MILLNWGPDDEIAVAEGQLSSPDSPGAFPRPVLVLDFQFEGAEEIVVQVNSVAGARALAHEILTVTDEVWGALS